MTEEIKVFNNLSDENLHFESKEEFNRYYNKNKETIDKMSTRLLNMKITIDGYRLGRLKKELTLFPIEGALGKRLGSIKENEQKATDSNDNYESMLEIKMDNISERLKNIEKMLAYVFKQNQTNY